MVKDTIMILVFVDNESHGLPKHVDTNYIAAPSG